MGKGKKLVETKVATWARKINLDGVVGPSAIIVPVNLWAPLNPSFGQCKKTG